jgi:hypothetical protein
MSCDVATERVRRRRWTRAIPASMPYWWPRPLHCGEGAQSLRKPAICGDLRADGRTRAGDPFITRLRPFHAATWLYAARQATLFRVDDGSYSASSPHYSKSVRLAHHPLRAVVDQCSTIATLWGPGETRGSSSTGPMLGIADSLDVDWMVRASRPRTVGAAAGSRSSGSALAYRRCISAKQPSNIRRVSMDVYGLSRNYS